MISDEKQLEPINDMLNPKAPLFGMPWWAILIVITLSVPVFLLPGCRIIGALLVPARWALGGGSVKTIRKSLSSYFMTFSYLRSLTQANDESVS